MPRAMQEKDIHIMKAIKAMAMLTVRDATRSSLFASALVLALTASAALPVLIKGDGSARGNVKIAVEYTLTAVMYVLGAMVLWTGVRAGGADIAGRQAHLLVTKPVSGFEIWIGKWVGLLFVAAALLAASGTAAYLALLWKTRPSALSPEERPALAEEVLVARSMIRPEMPVRPNWTARDRATSLRPGESRAWDFVPGRDIAGLPMRFEYTMTSPRQLEFKPVAVKWAAGPAGGASATVFEGGVIAGTRHSFALPRDAAGGDGRIHVEVVNMQSNPPADISFGRDSAAVFARTGGFGMNMLKVLVIIFCQLAALAALGLTAGCLLSTPVALFASASVVTILTLGSFINVAASDRDMVIYRPVRSISGMDRLMKAHFSLLNTVVGPLRKYNMISSLPAGRMVPWATVGKACGSFVLFYGGVMCLAGSGLFRRRELGLPRE